MHWIKTYGLAVVLALLLHAAALLFQFALVEGLEPKPNETVLQPKVVRATLIVLEEQVAASSMVTPPTISPVIPVPDTASNPTTKEEIDITENVNKTTEIKERLQTLEELRNSTLEDDVSDTLKSLVDIAVDEESASYINAINSAISANWNRPPSARRGMVVVLQVELFPNGKLNTVNVVESSGNDAFDLSAEKAVKAVKKFTVPDNTELFEKNFRVLKLRFNPEDLLR